MTYFILDREGFVCDLGTLEGMEEISQFCSEFIESGISTNKGVIAEAFEKVGRFEDAAKIRHSDPPLIITDGIVEE